MSTTTPTTVPSTVVTTPVFLYGYIVSVELNTTDEGVINLLRTVLRNSSYPISVSSNVRINSANISTVCSPSSHGYQCTCEEQYRWSCDLCLSYGSCDNVTNDTCGCIHGLPTDGQYCQPLDSNFTACPTSTPPPTTPTTPVTTPNATTVMNETTAVPVTNATTAFTSTTTTPMTTLLTTVANTTANVTTPTTVPTTNATTSFNSTTPTTIVTTLMTTIANTTLNATTVMSTTPLTVPSTLVTNATTVLNTTTPTPTLITNTTPNATTEMSTTPPTTVPTTLVTNATTVFNTTALVSTIMTSTTPNATTEMTTVTTTVPTTNTTLNATIEMTTVTTTEPTTNTTLNTAPITTIFTTVPTTNTTEMTTRVTTVPITNTTLNTTTEMTTIVTTVPSTNTTEMTTRVTTVPTTTTTTTTVLTTTPFPTTTTTITSTTTPNPVTISTTTTTTTYTTAAPTTKPPATTTTARPTGLKLSMSIELDKQYTPDLADTSSQAFKNFRDQVQPVLVKQYSSISGFLGVTIKGFSPGSIVTDYDVETTQINLDEVATANENLPQAMEVVAKVIGSVTSSFTASDSLTIPSLTYTGKSMTLHCGPPPPNMNFGQVTDAEWKFNGMTVNGGRYSKSRGNSDSSLTVSNVILADTGEYQCTLKKVLNYIQNGLVTKTHIKQAPNIRLNALVNAKCDGKILPLNCCVQTDYKVSWYKDGNLLSSDASTATGDYCIQTQTQKSCVNTQTITFTCQVDNLNEYLKKTTLTLFPDTPTCDDSTYGPGRVGDTSTIGCEKGQVGTKTAVCGSNGNWNPVEDSCIVEAINELLVESGDLSAGEVPAFTEKLSDAVKTEKEAISHSSTTILAIVEMVDTISNVSETVSEPIMKNVLETVDILTGDEAAQSWQVLNVNESSNASSKLLGALEHLSQLLVGEFTIATPRILLNRTTFSNSFSTNLNSSITVNIPDTPHTNVLITTIAFASLRNIMPARDASFNISHFNSTGNETVRVLDDVINAGVVLIKVNETINNVTLTYEKRNDSLSQDTRCVFWNFSLLDSYGAWDTEGCTFVSDINGTVTCNCNHLTSFSILMSTHIPESIRKLLDIMTYIGVGISLGSLVICLIIEACVWKAITRNSTALMRHVSIVNTALCLLIADICFIIAASVAKNPLENPGENYEVPVGPCSAATFFMHFFYLALFFWMLVSGLLLFYRTVMVFSHMSKSTMLAIGFCVGYGAPLIIAVVTVAATASRNGYIRKDEACWLNWNETMALLALVIPALTIVFINLIILFVVLYKMLRRGGIGDAVQSDEKHTLRVIVRCVLILTPLFGLTWSLGVGTMVAPTNEGIHIAFAFFNSLQGLFILIFGTLFDSKIRAILARKSPTSRSGSSSNRTRSTSGGTFSAILSRLPGRRNVYHLSQASSNSSNAPVESFTNI